MRLSKDICWKCAIKHESKYLTTEYLENRFKKGWNRRWDKGRILCYCSSGYVNIKREKMFKGCYFYMEQLILEQKNVK